MDVKVFLCLVKNAIFLYVFFIYKTLNNFSCTVPALISNYVLLKPVTLMIEWNYDWGNPNLSLPVHILFMFIFVENSV